MEREATLVHRETLDTWDEAEEVTLLLGLDPDEVLLEELLRKEEEEVLSLLAAMEEAKKEEEESMDDVMMEDVNVNEG